MRWIFKAWPLIPSFIGPKLSTTVKGDTMSEPTLTADEAILACRRVIDLYKGTLESIYSNLKNIDPTDLTSAERQIKQKCINVLGIQG